MGFDKLPSGLLEWERRYINGNLYQIIASDSNRNRYYLYEVSKDGKLIKTKSEKTPKNFEFEPTKVNTQTDNNKRKRNKKQTSKDA